MAHFNKQLVICYFQGFPRSLMAACFRMKVLVPLTCWVNLNCSKPFHKACIYESFRILMIRMLTSKETSQAWMAEVAHDMIGATFQA